MIFGSTYRMLCLWCGDFYRRSSCVVSDKRSTCLIALSRTKRTLHRLKCSSIATLTIHHDKIE